MSNSSNFWDSTKKKFKVQSASWRTKFKIKEFFNKNLAPKFRVIASVVKSFGRRILRLPKVLNRSDKIALLILFAILLGLLGYKLNRDWLAKTKKVPVVGGTYTEVLIGEARYLNPILAKSDTDKTIDHLIYTGLSKIDKSGQLVPDLAHDWEITPDGRSYIFHLRSGIFWHDGEEFSSIDVVATIETIKNENIKSPYYDAWKDVVVDTPDKDTVQFTLKDPYGPFIYNTLVGIIPAHVDSSSISSSPVGTGPYKFSKVISGKNSKIKEVVLERSGDYYGEKPYISQVHFQIAENENEAEKLFGSRGTTAVAGVKISGKEEINYAFSTSRYFGLVFNLRDDKFKDEGVRKKISASASSWRDGSASAKASLDGSAGEKFDPEFQFKLLVLDKPLHKAQAEEIQKNFEKFGVKVEIEKKNAINYQNTLEKQAFQAVLYGFDAGYDRDPYEFWHSSQAQSGLNFSGFSDKAADFLLEDARMTVDDAVRNQKYDQFFAILADKVPAIFFPNQEFQISVKNKIHGIKTITGSEPHDHLISITDWYIKTKRVKP